VGINKFFRRFFGRPCWPSPQAQRARGCNLLISVNAELLTNSHVVADADETRVGLLAEERMNSVATVVGRDPLTESALSELI
jgi:S1-C subfamily serine protease